MRLLESLIVVLGLAIVNSQRLAAEDVAIVKDGKSLAAIFVPERLLDDRQKNSEPAGVWRSYKAEDHRRRLRESILDFAGIVERISGAKLEIVTGAPQAGETRLPILVGELATAKFGKPTKSFPLSQGLRIVVSKAGLGVDGESDLGTSYAIYTLLDQLGCRWYLPSPLGEVLPVTKTIQWREQDLSTGPATIYRGIWYCDNDYARRNRLGGLELSAGHALEHTVPKKLRETNPEVRAMIGGKPHPHLVKWTHPLVAESLIDSFQARLEKDPNIPTFSLSPDDGASWDESDDAKFDASDFDGSTQTVSKTDRLMVLANRVAEAISPKYPNLKFGILAYVDYTRPPVREKVHPAVVPQIAPITFSRAHPMNHDGEPNNAAMRALVEGWGRAVPATSYYFYAFYLAEVSSPNPMITKWGHDVPFVFEKGRCQYWQPETMSNFETSMHALYLGHRMAWDPQQKPADIFQELHAKFYGQAARPMSEYWQHIDRVWVETPEYAGCGFGHLRRWTPTQMKTGRQLLDQAQAACATEPERGRVALADASFSLFERFMKLRQDLANGRWSQLAIDAKKYVDRAADLGEQHQPQFAFSRMPWTGTRTVNVRYFEAFFNATYVDAARVANDFQILTPSPIRQWRIQPDKENRGEATGWSQPNFDDTAWKQTDCVVDTWSALGLHNYMGAAWYRTKVSLPKIGNGKKVWLWIGATDGRVKVFVNGRHVPFVSEKKETTDTFTGYCQPASFDVTNAIHAEGENQISLHCTREFLNELGTGGLLAPVAFYTDKP